MSTAYVWYILTVHWHSLHVELIKICCVNRSVKRKIMEVDCCGVDSLNGGVEMQLVDGQVYDNRLQVQ